MGTHVITHSGPESAIRRADGMRFRPVVGWVSAVVAVMFAVAFLLPAAWTREIEGVPLFSGLVGESAGPRTLVLAALITNGFLVMALVAGIVRAIEFRSYLGAGATRTAIWIDGRRIGLSLSTILLSFTVVALLIARALDGVLSETQWADMAVAALLTLLTYVIAYELGCFEAIMFLRLTTLPALALTLPPIGLMVFAFNWPGRISGDPLPYLLIATIGVLVIIGNRWASVTMPIRRSRSQG